MEHAEVKTDAVQSAIDGARQIRLFREYRTGLVADVVTGKVYVRGAAARIPDERDDTESECLPGEMVPCRTDGEAGTWNR